MAFGPSSIPASSIETHTIESVAVMDADSRGTNVAISVVPFRDRNWCAYESFDLDIANERIAWPDE